MQKDGQYIFQTKFLTNFGREQTTHGHVHGLHQDVQEKVHSRQLTDVMNNWGANHGAISYGHVGADLITMASMLRIPVCMHNVPEEDIFRPAAWNAFGMDKEGADYRACAAYGPLYK